MAAIGGASQLLICLVLPGLAWGWVLPSGSDARNGGLLLRASVKIAEVAFVSLVTVLLLVLLLAEFSLLHPGVWWPVVLACSAAGLALGWRRDRHRLQAHLLHSLPGVVVLGVGLLAVLSWPDRGQWLAGGWDPGVYVNEGVQVSRAGTFYPPAQPAYRVLAQHGVGLLSRGIQGFEEAFPGIPVDPATGAFAFYFYRPAVAWHAFCALCCGVGGALVAPALAVFVAVVFLAGFLAAAGATVSQLVFVLLLFCTSPLVLYHSHTPCAEAVELALVGGLACVWTRRSEHIAYVGLLGVGLFAAAVNRPSFLLFGGVLALITAVLNLGRRDSRPLAEPFGMLLGLGLAVLYYQGVTPQSVVKISYMYRFILRALTILGVGALWVGVVGSLPRLRRGLSRIRPEWLYLAATSGLLLVGAWLYATDPRSAWELRHNTRVFLDYTSWTLAGLAAAGWVLWVGRIPRRSYATHAGGWILFLMTVGLMTLARKSVAELYPWATKRYLLFAPAVVALLGSLPIAALWRRKRRAAAYALLGLLLVSWFDSGHAGRIRRAWTHTEYNGLRDRLDAIAARLEERDVVLVDHFAWATPLCMVYGKQALNGVATWAHSERTDRMLRFFEDLAAQDMRIYFLTSSACGMDIFPARLQNAELVVRLPHCTYRTIAHHERSRDYWKRESVFDFRLYRWLGEGTSDGSRTDSAHPGGSPETAGRHNGSSGGNKHGPGV